METPELELKADGHGQRGEEETWDGDCEEESEATRGWQRGAFRRAGRQWKEAAQKDLKRLCLWQFLRKDPMVCRVAWERDAPWDGVWKSEELGWAL